MAGAVWDRPIAGNVIPLAGSRKEAGYTSEEWKLVYESRKILHAPELRAIESNWPKIKFHALREHAGLVFQKRLEG